MNPLLKLADRVEGLNEPDAEVLEEVRAAMRGDPYLDLITNKPWCENWFKLLEANAWLEAVMLLVPIGWSVSETALGDLEDSHSVILRDEQGRQTEGAATTRTLALAAAFIRARAIIFADIEKGLM